MPPECFGIWLHHPEALVIGLLGVVPGQVKQCSLVSALGHEDVHPHRANATACHLLGEQVFQSFTVFEIYWRVNVSRNVRLSDIELVEEGRKEFAGEKAGCASIIVCYFLRHIGGALFCRVMLGWADERTGPGVGGGGFRQVLPEEFAPVEHSAAAHVKQIYRQHAVFVVVTENIGVIAFDRSDALLLLQLIDG